MVRHPARAANITGVSTTRSMLAESSGDRPDPGVDEADRPAQIRIYLVQLQVMAAESLRLVLEQEPDFAVVGTQTALTGVRERIQEVHADVVLLDGALDVGWLSAALHDIDVSPKIIVMAGTSDLLIPSLAAGAVGYLSESSDLRELVWAIRQVYAGGVALTAEQLVTLLHGVTARSLRPAEADLCASLTDRERAVLQVLATGASMAETAKQLYISINTARTHLRNVMDKLNVQSKLAAVLMALRAGIIEEPAE